ncbi:uncharacterized protein Z518_03684 [Rhinocladiella mackenziei CBS 650.93]|uniref:DUF2264 domain-containing protein n=1 Tax=Rhinocladiella mackenziei CBS 650.93 TaxID=1442369 RepID=A0A0D2FUD1_9EURO|nr:uncharacterized protein Z518_03684 [Rhinocladiella mackenziei CBS 650.93]KIX05712.1 hypothetical protein Z518_03684 [Rhinocladiella mackenziei CBS 650.93]
MPRLAGFSDNPFRTREDVRAAALALLQNLCKYQSPGCARIRVPVSTGAHFDETAAQLEGYARPLWVMGALLSGEAESDELAQSLAESFVRGLANGTSPDHPEYWGPVVGRDQRMVEMEIVSFALLSAPHAFFHKQTPEAKANITSWLKTIIGKDMPTTNWLWFRVMTNLALIKVCGLPQEPIRSLMNDDLDALDTFCLQNGWASDGPWSDQGRQADYYSGSFAIQFSQLLYAKFAKDIDPERCKTYLERARNFAGDFCHYFDTAGAAIPFGRSLTYRFALAGFWSAAAYAEVELPHPLDDPGVVKGLLLRHLRWWSSKYDIFHVDGTLNIGFLYPNMFMCEDYNSPQSVYWCMKTLCVLGLSNAHPFWRSREQALPSAGISLAKAMTSPMHIVCNTGSHHFLLSSGQFCPWPLKATEAKYGKFAYSSHFGFSVPTGPLVQQMAPDSTLALSADEGDTWKVRWVPLGTRFGTATLVTGGKTENVPVLISSWKPWRLLDVMVSTALIPPSDQWPHWHIRVHQISTGSANTRPDVMSVEGGFAIYGRQMSDGLPIRPMTMADFARSEGPRGPLEAIFTDSDGCLVCSADGASGIRKLQPIRTGSYSRALLCQLDGFLLKPDANTNLMRQRTVIPTLKGVISSDTYGEARNYLMAVGVFAMADQSGNIIEKWNAPPDICLGDDKECGVEAHIKLDGW